MYSVFLYRTEHQIHNSCGLNRHGDQNVGKEDKDVCSLGEPENLLRYLDANIHHHTYHTRRILYASTCVGILTWPFLRSWCGIPYRQPTPLGSLPFLPTLSTLISRNTKSHLR